MFDPAAFKEARIRAGFSQLRLARMLGICHNSISRWERGIRGPDEDLLDKAMRAINGEAVERNLKATKVDADGADPLLRRLKEAGCPTYG